MDGEEEGQGGSQTGQRGGKRGRAKISSSDSINVRTTYVRTTICGHAYRLYYVWVKGRRQMPEHLLDSLLLPEKLSSLSTCEPEVSSPSPLPFLTTTYVETVKIFLAFSPCPWIARGHDLMIFCFSCGSGGDVG